jgi:hypothetical protein
MSIHVWATALPLFFAILASAQQPQNPPVITKPDLAGNIRQAGEKLIVTIDNDVESNPNNGSGKAPRSKAELKIGNLPVQIIAVPELKPLGSFEHIVAIPSGLLNQLFSATLKVDAGNAINENNENNNIFTKKFNECDLVLVKNDAGFLAMTWDEKNKPGIFTFKVKNAGIRKTPASGAQVIVNEPGKPKMTQGVSIPAIDPGATVTLEFKFTGKICKTYFQVECDPRKSVEESNEGNNMAFIKPTCEN